MITCTGVYIYLPSVAGLGVDSSLLLSFPFSAIMTDTNKDTFEKGKNKEKCVFVSVESMCDFLDGTF